MSSVEAPPASAPAPAAEALPSTARRVRGPTALGSDPRRFWTLTLALAATDFKLRFFGTALGYLWQLMRPLALFGVLYLLFAVVLALDDAPFYAEAMLLALVLYTFLSDASKAAVDSIVQRENLVRKIDFPRLAVPMSVVLNALFNLVLNLLPVFAFLLLDGGSVTWSWLQLPILIVLLGVFAAGLAMLLSALYVRYRDVNPIWDVVLVMIFYGSPIFYTIDLVETEAPGAGKYLMLNPLAVIIQQARHAVLGEGHPGAIASSGGGGTWLVVPALIGLAVVVGGWLVFQRRAPRIAEEL